MPDLLLAVLIPAGLLGGAAVAFLIWAARGTERPVEHHSSMPSKPDWPEG